MKKINRIPGTFLIIQLFLVLFSCTNNSEKQKDNEIEEAFVAEPVPEPVIEYDRIMVDSLEILEGYIKRNQPISILLNEYGINNGQINELVEKSKDVFDLRKIRSGRPYYAFFSSDTIHTLHYLIYEHTPLEYIGFQFVDSMDVWKGQKAVDTVFSSFTGTIESSLWNCMMDNGGSPLLANELEDIYAWSIDFFGLQVGDSLKVIYDEYFVKETSIGIGTIHGAYFKHMNTDFWAIPFIQDSISDFYDDEGQSLRKAFLKAPLKFSRISSRFSNSRLHPILKIRRPHHGVDYAAPVGTPVVSIGDGVVTKMGYSGGAGHMVKIKHNSVYSTAYLHLSRYGEGVKGGAYVKQGQVIGYVGSTGLSTGPHLDFRFYKSGAAVDPLKVEAPPVDPVREENLERFNETKTKVIKRITEG